jgi:hypothetical protein
MSDPNLFVLLEDAGARVDVGPAPLTDMRAAVARRRRRRTVGGIVATAVAGGALVVGAAAVGRIGSTAQAPDHPSLGGSAAPSVTPSDTATVPPRPAPITMQTVRRFGRAQEFRPYTGPQPPPISETEALRRAEDADGYSLGLWDVGMVHEGRAGRSVDWHSVWIIAAERFVPDVNELSLGGPGVRPGVTTPPQEPRPGWIRSVTMLDARTGKFFLAYVF